MTEQEWLAGTDVGRMLAYFGIAYHDEYAGEPPRENPMARDDALSRTVRLFACACCRRAWPLLPTGRSRRAVEVAERFADRQAGGWALVTACLATIFHTPRSPGHIPGGAASLVGFSRGLPIADVLHCVASAADALSAGDPAARQAETAAQAALLWDLFGNPFRPVGVDRAWRTPVVLQLAADAYEARALPAGTLDPARLAALADALEEARCADPDVLGHLRGPGPHVRGCWAVDLLLGKE